MLKLLEYFKNDEFDKFLAEFPQDRKNRLDVANFLIKLKQFSVGKNGTKIATLRSTRFSTFSIMFSYADVEEYSVMYVHYKVLRNIYRPYTMVFVFGEDDSGIWVEAFNLNTLVNAVDKASILMHLGAGRNVVANNSVLASGLPTFGATPNFRLQGDINIRVDNIVEALENVMDLSFMQNVFQDRFPESNGNLGKLPNFKELYETFLNIYNRFLIDTGAMKPISVWNLDNHKITLYNAFGYERWNEFRIFVSGDDDGKLVIESPHHKTVSVGLKVGKYVVFRSGGIQLQELEGIFKNIGELWEFGVSNYKKNKKVP